MQDFLHMGGVCSEAIESQNVVGYMGSASGDNNNFLTIQFSAVGFNTSDIQQIKLSDGGAMSIGWGGENFSVWEGVPTVAEGSAFMYNDPSMDPSGEAQDYYWGDADFNLAKFSVAPGQAVVIDCVADLNITVAGQVTSKKIEFTSIDNNNFTGNSFAAPIDIQNIKISDDGAMSIGWGGENFSNWLCS